MTTSRQRLLEYIRSRRVVKVDELSRALKMTPANARHHLSILQEQGLVRTIGQEAPEGKGRPAFLYSLTEELERHSLDLLSEALLDELLAGMAPQEQDQLLARLAQRLLFAQSKDETRPIQPTARSLTQAIYQTIQHLSALNYQARWEAHADGPRLILGHCPYAAIIDCHPELCRIDSHLLEQLLGQPVTQNAKLMISPQGNRYCLFVARKD